MESNVIVQLKVESESVQEIPHLYLESLSAQEIFFDLRTRYNGLYLFLEGSVFYNKTDDEDIILPKPTKKLRKGVIWILSVGRLRK